MADSSSTLTAVFKARDEASKEVKKVEGSLSSLGSSLAKVGIAAAAMGAAAAAAMGAFAISSIKQFSEVGDAVEKMSKRTGLGAEAVSALRVAAQMGGTSIDTLEGSIKKLQIGMDGIGVKGTVMADVLAKNGVAMAQIKALRPEEQFEKLGNLIGSIPDATLRTQAAFEVFGKSGTDLLPMFENGQFSMKQWSDEAKKLGVSFDDLSANKAAQLDDAIGAMTTAWNGLKLKVGGELAPVITDFLNNQLIPMASQALAALPSIDNLKTGFDRMKVGFVQALGEFDAKTGIITALREAFAQIWNQLDKELIPALIKLWEANQPLMPYFQALAEVVAGVLVIAIRLLIEVLTIVVGWLVKFATWQADIQTAILKYSIPAINLMTQALGWLGDRLLWVVGRFNDMKQAAVDAYNWASRAAAFAVSNTPTGMAMDAIGNLVGRASGGPVSSGRPYLVGESGMELFVPSQSGTIVSNANLGAGGGASVSISIGNFFGGNPEMAARDLGDLIIKRLQLNARV
jgi:hypothetical protein